jgi:tellurite resistance protein
VKKNKTLASTEERGTAFNSTTRPFEALFAISVSNAQEKKTVKNKTKKTTLTHTREKADLKSADFRSRSAFPATLLMVLPWFLLLPLPKVLLLLVLPMTLPDDLPMDGS